MSHERLGYLVLGIVLAAAVLYAFLALRSTDKSTAPIIDPIETEVGRGETQPPSQEDLDKILSELSTTEQSSFDPDTTDWVGYSDGQDGFVAQRPRGWSVNESSLVGDANTRRIIISEGAAAFAVFPKGEFDVGLPTRTPTITKLSLAGEPATMHEWSLPDGSWLAIVTHDSQPKNGFRIELSTLNSSLTSRAILKEMLNRFSFL